MTTFGAATNPGRREGENEDSIGVIPERSVWFVADGVGGHGHGAVASGIVRKVLLEEASPDTLVKSIQAAHAAILDAERADPILKNMGSTVVAAGLSGSICRLAWVGDSRAYQSRRGKLTQLTVDHSVRQLLLAQGPAGEALLVDEPDADALVRALGMEAFEPSVKAVPLCKHDRILLCSDGLTKELSDADIETILGRIPAPQEAADALVSQALANGGHDNVSVVVIAYEGRTDATLRFQGLPPRRVLVPLLAGMLAALACAVIWFLATRPPT